MNRQNYRAAFDAVDFSPDFEERTLQKLAAMRHASEKEQNKMSMNRTKKLPCWLRRRPWPSWP